MVGMRSRLATARSTPAFLPDLTDGDLAQLGVNLGDRKRLLKAIASLGAASPVTKPTRLSSSIDGAERRPITVMFCDLVGSTSLAAKLDAEDWRNLVNGYLDEVSAAVTTFGGHVLKKLGDGLMALFGYPKAQESDAERAVRAALAIHRALGELNERNAASGAPALAARIGLESGLVVVDATGEVFGEAPNVAARVQAAAEPGRSWSHETSNARSPGSLSRRSRARANSRVSPSRSSFFASFEPAVPAEGAARGR